MVDFENELLEVVKNIKFQKVRITFQQNIQRDIKNIRNSTLTMTLADKLSNMYRLKKEEYKKLITNSIITSYKKVSNNIKSRINVKGKEIMTGTAELNKMHINGEACAFTTLKDHKENFPNNHSYG